MNPNLPSNPWTITPIPDPVDVEWLKSARNSHDDQVIERIDRQLQSLRDYDSYYRETCLHREGAKLTLQEHKAKLLAKKTS